MGASIADIMVALHVDDGELGKLDAAGQKIDSLGTKGQSVGKSMQTVGLGMSAIGAAGGAMFGAALNSAANFEQSMDFVGAALGGVGTASGITEAQFASLSAQAQELGSTTQYTAGQVASVQEELGKSGVAAEDLLSGATDAVLNLSAATGEDLVTSAQVAAGAMNTFGLSGDKMGYVADTVTGALNNSSMSLKDFNTGMGYLGPTLAQTGGDFDDAAAAIAYFSKEGMKGADAGVSLNRMIDNLVRPKNLEAAGLFKQLGISAFDANGELKPIPDMLDNISDAMQGMNEQEKLELVSKLFGAESADVVLRALSGAGDGIRDMNDAITETGIAQTQASQRMDNFKGDVETLGGALDTAAQKITSAFLPAGRAVVQFATQVVDAFNNLPGPIQAAIGAFLGIGSAITAGLGAALLIVPKILEFQKAFVALKAAADIASIGMKGFMTSLGPIGIALAVISLAVLAYQNNWLGFRDAVNQVADALGPKLQQGAEAAGRVLKAIGTALEPVGKLVADTAGQFKDWLGSLKPFQAVFDAIGDGLGFLADRFGELDTRTQAIILLFGGFGVAFLAAEAAVKALGDAFNAAAGPIGDFSARVQQGLQGLSDAVMGGLGNLSSWLQSTFGPAFEFVAEKAGALRTALEGLSIPDGLQRAFEWLQTNVGDKIKGIVDRLGDMKDALIGIAIPAPLLALGEWFGNTLGGMIQASIEKLNEFAKSLGIVNTEIQKTSASAQSGIQTASDGAVDLLNSVGMWGEGILGIAQGTDQAVQATEDYVATSTRLGTASKANIAAMEEQKAATAAVAVETQELSEYQKNLIDSYREALPAVRAFMGQMQMWVPLGQDILDVMDALGAAGGLGTGIGAVMSGFVDGLSEANQALNGVLGTMSQIASLGAGLASAQDVAQKLVGDPGVYAVVDDLLAKGLITREQLIASQADEIRVVQANTAAQDALNVMRLNQVDALAQASEEQSSYLVALSQLPAAEQAHALAMMDSANQAKVAAAMSTAYSVSLGEIPENIGTDIIANAAQADPVLRQLLLDYGVIEEGVNGEVTVTFPDASAEALRRFEAAFTGAEVRSINGLIEVTQSNGSVLVYDQFNNLVEQSGSVITAEVDVKIRDLSTAMASGAGFGAGGVSNVGTGIVDSIKSQVDQADYSPITAAAEAKVSAAVTAVNPTELTTTDIGPSITTSVATSITDTGGTEITTAIETVVSDAVTAASTTAVDASKIGLDLVTNAVTGITDNSADFSTAATTMVSDAVTKANTEAATSDAVGIEFVAQATNGVTNDDDNFVTAATDMVSTAVSDATTKAADALGVGQEYVAQATSGISQDGTNFSTQGQTMVSDAVTNNTGTAADAIGIGEEYVTQATAGITNNAATFAQAGTDMVQSAIDAAAAAGAGMLATGQAIGADLGQGLINGMASMVGAVQSQAAALASAAETGARTRLGTRSPSKVFYAIGVDTVQGFINAIHDRIADVFKALGLMADGATDAFTNNLGDASYDAGTESGKRLKEGLNESTGDPSDYEVGSDEWHQALQDKIANSMGDIGRESGKRLKKGIESETDSSSIADTLAELVNINSALQGTADAWGGVEDAISASGISSKDATTAISAMAEELRTVGAGNKELTYLADQFDLLVTDIRQAGGTMDTELLDRIGRLGKELPFALESAGMAFGRFGKMSADEVVKSMAQMIEDISATLRELVDVMREAFGMAAKEGTDAFADACYPGLKDAMAGGETVIQDGAKDWESALITSGEWAGQTIGEAMANGMTQKEADWLNTMGMVVDRVVKKSVGNGKGGLIGEETVKQAGLGVSRKEAEYTRRMTEMVGKGVDAGKTKAAEFSDVGEASVDATAKGMQSEQPDLLKTAEQISASLVKTFGDRVQAMYDIGKNFAEGFALGMLSAATEVKDAANQLGSSAEKELRKATESASPSKAAMRVGEDVGQGFADGVGSKKSERAVAQAAKKLWRAAWKELKDNIKEAGFLGADWAVEFWQGMLNSPDMTGPLAAWITDQMVAAADTALKKIRAELAGIAAQLDIARAAVGTTSIPEVPPPAPVDTAQRDLLQQQLDATKELTAALEKAFTSAFDAAHKAHVAFVKGVGTEGDYMAKLQVAQNAYAAKESNAAQIAGLEAQVKAAQAAIDAETAARQKAYEEAVKAREAAVEAEKQAQEQAVAQLEQAQRDAQMEMTQAVIDEANQRIREYERELRKATDPQMKAELKAKIALEKERIDVANQLAAAIDKANNATNAFDLSTANAQIEFLVGQLTALEQVDVGGMLQGIADAITEAADKMAAAADKIKRAFNGGGGGKNKGEKDKGTQDASDPGLGGGMSTGGGGGITQEFDNVGKAGRKMGDDVAAGMGVADMAIRKTLGTTLPEYVKGMGDAGTKGGKAIGDHAEVAVKAGEASFSKTLVTSVEGATLNGEKIAADRGKVIGVTVTTNMETGVKERTREVTKTVDGVVKESTDAAVPTAQQGGTKIGDGFITFTSKNISQGQNQVTQASRQVMQQAGQQAAQTAQTEGKRAGADLSKFAANGIDSGRGAVRKAGKQIMDDAGAEAKRDANRLGRNAGDDLGRGVAEGIRGRTDDVRRAAKELSDAANSGGGGGGGNGGGGNPAPNPSPNPRPNGGGGGNGGNGHGGNRGKDAELSAVQVGKSMSSGMAQGISSGKSDVERAAAELANAADKAARKKTKSHSPSLVWMKHGHDMGDGMVIGLLDRIGDAQDAARALVYIPQGLPASNSVNSNGNVGSGQGGGTTVVKREYHFHGDIHVPNARVFEEIVDRKTRMNNVAASRGQ